MNTPPRIAFLDAATVTRGDLDFSALEKLGELTCHDTTSLAELPGHARGAEVLITNKVPLDQSALDELPDLKLILVAATGYNIFDLEAARARDIPICNVAGYSTRSVTQHVFSLLLNLVTSVHAYDREITDWPNSPIFTRLDHRVEELAGKKFGIIGLGGIGSAVAQVAEAFGMAVQVYGRPGSSNTLRPDLPRLTPEDFFRTADVVSLHCPLTAETTHLINEPTLRKMKTSAYLINTGRGPLVDEQALADALAEGTIAGAGLDVLGQEPPASDNPLLQFDGPNLVITPHTAWTSIEARQTLLNGLAENLRAFLDGSPVNVVN